VRVLDEADIPAVQDLDSRIASQLSALDKKFFYAHDEDWYKRLLKSGNRIVGMFNTQSGALVSKANLTIDSTQLNPTGLNATSAMRRAYAGEFGKNGSVALLSGIGTDHAYRGRGAQSTVLRALFEHANRDCGKSVLAAIVEPRNIASLSVLSGSGMWIKELNSHPIERADYFLLSGNLKSMMAHAPLTILPQALKDLNGSVDALRMKIRNKETQIAVPLDIADKHADNLYNSPHVKLITDAFDLGYAGVQVAGNVNYDPADPSRGAKNYMVMELAH
jgi:RimJ/RimL family protein N-acetyltransferase